MQKRSCIGGSTMSVYNVIHQTQPVTLTSDASNTEWECVCGHSQSGGQWLPEEKVFHINYLKLKAAFFALKCFQKLFCGRQVRIMIDNITALACLNHMGTSH